MQQQNNTRRTFKMWLENFWYYYKWHTIVALVVVLAITVSLAQCVTRRQYDYSVIFACGEAKFSNAQLEALQEQLNPFAEDLNGDGVANVQLIECTYDTATSSLQTVQTARQKMQSILMNDNRALLIISDDTCFNWINSIREGGFMQNLSLPEQNGRALNLNCNKLYDSAKATCAADYKWPNRLLISRRIVTDTLIAKDKETETNRKNADAFIERVQNNQPVTQK